LFLRLRASFFDFCTDSTDPSKIADPPRTLFCSRSERPSLRAALRVPYAAVIAIARSVDFGRSGKDLNLLTSLSRSAQHSPPHVTNDLQEKNNGRA
jgi:hypothetical protein